MAEKLIEVKNLQVTFGTGKKKFKAVDQVSFDIFKGETFAVVGESGSGKTTIGRALLRINPVTSGEILFKGRRISGKISRELDQEVIRKCQMIFQDPYASLDSRMTVMDIIREALDLHSELTTKEQRSQRVYELLDHVGLMREHANRYPHEFSGGQRQRIGIARALAVNPEFIVCDEPISALDVSIQAQVVNMLEDLQREFGLTYLFIAHDLSMVRHISNRIGVMYLGSLVELAESYELNKNPLHPYTKTLLSAVPVPDPEVSRQRQRIVLEGDIPSPMHPPKGCRFHTRCPYATQLCAEQEPPLTEVGSNHAVACHRVTPARGNEEKGGIL